MPVPASEVKVGYWYCICCELDLSQIKDEEELKELVEDDDCDDMYRFWETKEAALKELLTQEGK